MARNRKQYDAKTKFRVVVDILQGRKTQAQITSEYGVHPTQQNTRKAEFLERGPEIFADKRKPENQDQEKKIAHLERKVGQYAVEVDWLQKKIEGIPLI